ncbi:hypothetical protein KUTeg_003791 [Tegillarca granosa]|uniref:Promethin n=1 Tax=Tegillarca granosa TaxID=220873 RepID=A0ABQ9FR01_TEGGR|nr:hypothetical protein KUTeg_003791 [Tegillarca granosa]
MGGKMEEEAEESKLTAFLQTMDECFDLETKLHNAKEYALTHPVTTLFLIITVAMCSIPIFCFFVFAFGSTVLAFTGFLFVEGTVLTIGTLVLAAVLCFVGLLSVGFSSFLVLTYVFVRFGQSVLQKAWQKVQLGQTTLKCDSTTK